MEQVTSQIMSDFKLALSLMTGYNRRQYAAKLSKNYFSGSARKTERALGVSRAVVELGIKEQESGFRCMENFSLRGRKKKNRLS